MMLGSWLKTFLLMATIVALFGAVGYMLAGSGGMLLALALAGAMNFWAYWNSDRLVLRMYRAQPVDETSAPELHGMVQELAERAGLPTPKVYLIHEDQPNAFATGRNPENAAVAATTGIMQLLTPRELRGVMAHELAHVRHRDTLISTISATLAGAISSIAHFGMLLGGHNRDGEQSSNNPLVGILIMFFAPLAAMLIQFAVSRSREFEADRGGAEISGDPKALAAALDKIERYAKGLRIPTAERHPETAQMMIVNPLSGGGLRGLFSTHPSTQERVARLLAMRG
jgi:heat shock protein HtpX